MTIESKKEDLEALARDFSRALPGCLGGTPRGLRFAKNPSKVSFRLENLDYDCEFNIDDYGQVNIHLRAYSEGKTIKFCSEDERKISNTEVDKTHYISHRRLSELSDGAVSVTCRVKRNLPEAGSRSAFYADIVRYVIGEVARSAIVS
ncbi:MAG: hypothetical protein MUF61_02760 [archaeon]|jgi:hypothetical protein|nr:hypothetical protein [archaeon]